MLQHRQFHTCDLYRRCVAEFMPHIKITYMSQMLEPDSTIKEVREEVVQAAPTYVKAVEGMEA